jgi:hypothetical protein
MKSDSKNTALPTEALSAAANNHRGGRGVNSELDGHPEFGRHQDVRRLYGIKRGILYRLMNEGKIRSITLREPGRRFGCRLIYLPSVRNYLNSLLDQQSPVQVKPNFQQQQAHADGVES